MVSKFTLKRILFFGFFLLAFTAVEAQSVGDWESQKTGTKQIPIMWDDQGMWKRYDGTSWVDVTNYPGESETAGVVTLKSGSKVLLNVSPPHTVGGIKFEEDNKKNIKLSFETGQTLHVDGDVSFTNPFGNKNQRINVDEGTLTCASIKMVDTGQDDSSHKIKITSGTVTVSGDITMLGSGSRNFVEFKGGGVLNIGGSMSGGSFDRWDGSNSTVNFNGNGLVDQNINGYVFENIKFSGDAKKVLNADITVDVTCNIEENSNLYCQNNQIIDNGTTTTFTLNDGATLGIGSANGITATSNNGNILLDTRNYSTSANYIYNGTVAQIPGDGLPSTVNQLSIEFPGDLTVANSMTITSELNLQGGRLILEANDLLLLDGAVIKGTFDADHMIVVDGGTVTKQSTDISAYNTTFPLGTYNAADDVYEYTPTVISDPVGSTNGIGELSVKLVNDNAPEAIVYDLGRYWELTESNLSFSSVGVEFLYLQSDVRSSDETAYESKRASSISSNNWLDWGSIDTDAKTLSAIGLTQLQGIYTGVEQIESESWYSLKSGVWNSAANWTTDPSGAVKKGPVGYIPNTNTDNVVILSGDDITMDLDKISCNYLTVEGNLHFGTREKSTFAKIFGSGRIYMHADNFPAGDARHFVSKNQGEGTVIYQGSGYALKTGQIFYDIEVNLTDASSQITLLADLTVNNNLTLTKGDVRINRDNGEIIPETSPLTSPLNIIVAANVDVATDASISVGTENTAGTGSLPGGAGQYHSIYHQLIIKGNLTNRGTVRLTNETAPRYDALSTIGAVTLRFEGATNNKMSLYGTTDLYNLVVDKGIDKTYVLELYSDNVNDFRIFGANNASRITSSPFTTVNPEQRKALWICNGTLKLTGSIHIPTLTEGGNDFAIGENARLWLAGPDVTVYSTVTDKSEVLGFETTAIGVAGGSGNQAFALIGELKVEDGFLGTRNSAGLVYWPSSNSIFEINGGTVNICQFRSTGGASGKASYTQSGGQVIVRGDRTETGEVKSSVPIFGLSSEDDVFAMSGGEILIQDDSGYTYDLYIPSTEDNANVTGGTIRFYEYGNTEKTYDLYMVPSVYNLIIDHEQVDEMNQVNLHQPLTVLNDLTINGSGFLNHGGRDVTIGGDFSIAADAYNNGDNNCGYLYNVASPNTTTFNGDEDAVLYVGHTIRNSAYELFLGNVILNKPAGKTLTVTGDLQKTIDYQQIENLHPYRANLLKIENDLTIESGILSQGKHNIRLYGATNIVKANGQCGVYDESKRGSSQDFALIMFKDGYIHTEEGAVFGNLKINPDDMDAPVGFTSDVYVKRISYLNGAIDLGTYNLKVDYLDSYNNDFITTPYKVSEGMYHDSNPEYMYTEGNVSDGGLTVKITKDGTYAFPLGIGEVGVDGKYTPAEVIITDFANDGYITIRPVDAELTTTNLTGGNLLNYYWRVGHADFTDLPTVQYKFKYDDSDDLNNAEADFYPGKVLDEAPYTRYYEAHLGNVDENNTITFNDSQTTTDDVDGVSEVTSNTTTGFTLENANYTAGVSGRFKGTVKVFYTRRDGDGNAIDWSTKSTWTYGEDASHGKHDSRQDAADAVPGPGDVAIIGWVPWDDVASLSSYYGMPHGVDANGNITCAEVVFNQMTDADGNPVPRAYRENFQFRPTICINNGNSLTANMVRGEGMFWNRQSDPDMSTMDLGEFAANDSAYVLYEITAAKLNNTPDLFPNLLVASSGWGGSNHTFSFTKDIVTNGNFEILGDVNVKLDAGTTGDITIGRDLYMFMGTSGGGAELYYQNNGTARTVSVGRNIVMSNTDNRIYVSGTGGTLLDHRLYVNKDIVQTESGAGLDLWTSNTAEHVTLYLEGEDDMVFNVEAASVVPDLYRVVVNKGTGSSVEANFVSDFNLHGQTGGAAKALELNNGSLIIENTDIDVNLTTGGANFDIPSTAALVLKDGTLSASGSSGINLDGLLQIEGGKLKMDGADNPIVYSASGNATLNITGGALTVGGQIRRGTVSEIGLLNYNQSAGTVRVGTNTASVADRGVLEVLGTGSSFVHSGGSLFIENAQTSANVAALLLDPETSDVGETSWINIGGASTNASQTIGINSVIPLNNIKVDNRSGNDPVAQLSVLGLSLNNNLDIDTGAGFTAAAENTDDNGWDLIIGGDLICNGIFTHGKNTAYFNGSSDQTITGDVNFYNLDKNGDQSLILDASGANLDIDNNLAFVAGTLVDNGNEIAVQRNVTFNGTHINDGGNGLVMNGTLTQSLNGSGTLDVLTINNKEGVEVPYGNNFTINSKLRLQSGVFNIDRNLLILNAGSSIEDVSTFSAKNMVQTNISFTDNGVRKYFNSGATSFTYPMGAGGKYTPVTVDMTANTSSVGYITVIAADEYHTSVDDPTNVLNYHWTLKSEDIDGFTGTIKMKYDPNDVKVTDPNTIDNYISARLLADGSGDWNKPFGIVEKNAEGNYTDYLLYTYTTAITSDELTGDYTAGVNEAIPDKVPTYISVADGPWDFASTWEAIPATVEGVPVVVPDGGPRGSIVIIDAGTTVSVTADAITSYQTTINGTLSLGTTTTHRLGQVDGTGAMKAETGDMPAGVYTDFISTSGGTLEYAGSSDYSILGAFTSVNNITLSGSGERRLPNTNLTVNGNLVTDGASLVNNNDKNLTLKKNFTFNSGGFDSGNNGAQTIFSGTALQYFNGTGSLTDANGIDHFVINNPIGVSMGIDVDIDSELSLTGGIVYNNLGNQLVVKSATINGGGAASYVQGPLSALVNNNASFSFPVGDGDRLGDVMISQTQTVGADYWTAEYFNEDPAVNSKAHSDTPVGDVKLVSKNEFWRIMGPASSKANVTLRWDATSGVTPDESFRVVDWQNGATEWTEIDIDHPVGDATAGTVKSLSSKVLDFNEISGQGNYYTFGTINIVVSDWKGHTTDWFTGSNWGAGVVPNASTNITITNTENDPIVGNSGVAQVNNLTINTDCSLTLSEGADFTVNGNLVTNNQLTVKNTVAKPSVLMTKGTVTGDVNYEWDGFTKFSWWHIGHPINGVSESEYNASFGASAADQSRYALNKYTITGWERVAGFSSPVDTYSFNSDNKLEGYNLYPAENKTLKYSGPLNNDESYSRDFSSAQWWHVANPYPTYIDVESLGFDFGNFEKTVYIRGNNQIVSTYDLVNKKGTNGGSRFISPGQCMWLKTKASSDRISIFKSARVVNNIGNALKSASQRPDNVIKLSLTSEYGTDESIVIFNMNGSELFTEYDSEKLMNGGNVASLYSLKDDKNIAINSLPELEADDVVPLGYRVGDTGLSNFTISAAKIDEFRPEVDVYLVDKIDGVVIDLRKNPTYTFTPSSVQTNDRFELKFEANTTDVDDKKPIVSRQNVLIYAVQQKANVKVAAELLQGKERLIEVYDLSGQLVSQHDLELTDTEFVLPQRNTMYIIKVSIDNNSYQEKVIALN